MSIIGSHTGDNLLKEYQRVTTTFNIQTKVVRLITDNASNNLSAFGALVIPGFEPYFEPEDGEDGEDDDQYRSDDDEMKSSTVEEEHDETDQINVFNAEDELIRLPCFIHTLQLVVKDGLDEARCIRSTMAKVAAIAKLSHQSTAVAERLQEINMSIPLAVKTRWNSQYLTVLKILDVPSGVLVEILTDEDRTELVLSIKDIAILREFISIFALFAEATVQTQTGSGVSVSLVAPSVLGIYFDLENERNVCKYSGSLCAVLLQSMKQRFGGLLLNLELPVESNLKRRNTFPLFSDDLFLVATFLDAQFKLRWITQSALDDDTK